MSRITTGKWQKYCCLQQDTSLVQYLPGTVILSEQSLSKFLHLYQKVVLKPDGGARGIGILVVRETESNRYELQSLWKKRVFASCRQLFRYLARTVPVHRYIIQQCIPLARMNGRLFDLRIMVQRGEHSHWEITGSLAKIAYRGMAVTNPEEYVKPMNETIRNSSLANRTVFDLLEEIHEVCIRATHQLCKEYPRLTIIGYDIGIDKNGHVWIIEPNFSPAIYWFKQLPERQTYKRIVAYKRKYGVYRHHLATPQVDDEYYYYY